MRHGVETLQKGGAIFRLWAPSAHSVALELDNAAPEAMLARENGWYELLQENAHTNARYRFLIDGEHFVPDPASHFQPDGVDGASEIIGHAKEPAAWQGRAWEEAVIYELHVGSFSPTGDYQGVEAKLDYLAELGVTAIELMPLAAFEGKRGWGYDGVLPYAPHAAYGTPQALKQLIAAAHAKGLMMILDVVYNHFGPAGNYLHHYAKSFFTEKYQTPWGAAIDFTQGPVRDFFIQNALYWLEEYQLDGLRFDAVHAITDPSPVHFLSELAQAVHTRFPAGRHIHLILENDKNEAHFLERDVTAQWNDDIHHVLHVLLTRETSGYYRDYRENPLEKLGRCLAQGFAYQGEPSTHREGKKRGEPSAHLPPGAFVSFLQNHDQIGNRALGERMSALASEEKLTLGMAILLLAPHPPMLFMGEEWASQTPFLYFCDFTGGLADAVREGRRKEFPELGAQANIPDPNAPESFERSRLDWREPEQEPYHKRLAFTRKLLTLRRQHILPLLRQKMQRSLFDRIEDRGVEVRWQFADGRVLRLLANFSDNTLDHGRKVEGEHVWGNFAEALPAWKCAVAIERKP